MEHSGAVLSDRDIRREIENGNIVLHDPDRDCKGNIQNCSVDITLGPNYYSDYLNTQHNKNLAYFNPWNAKHVHEYWGELRTASLIRDNYYDSCVAEKFGLKTGDQYILVYPGENILAHTQEFVGGRNHITTMVKARSSMGRSNVTICRDAGWGDINFCSRWTLEITNNGRVPVVLPVGARIGQIIFFYTGTPDTVYSGKYQTGTTLDEIVAKWEPSMMLPKLHLETVKK